MIINTYQKFCIVPIKTFVELINISSMRNTINTEFSFVEVWFTDQAGKALEIGDNVNLTREENEIFNRTKI